MVNMPLAGSRGKKALRAGGTDALPPETPQMRQDASPTRVARFGSTKAINGMQRSIRAAIV